MDPFDLDTMSFEDGLATLARIADGLDKQAFDMKDLQSLGNTIYQDPLLFRSLAGAGIGGAAGLASSAFQEKDRRRPVSRALSGALLGGIGGAASTLVTSGGKNIQQGTGGEGSATEGAQHQITEAKLLAREKDLAEQGLLGPPASGAGSPAAATSAGPAAKPPSNTIAVPRPGNLGPGYPAETLLSQYPGYEHPVDHVPLPPNPTQPIPYGVKPVTPQESVVNAHGRTERAQTPEQYYEHGEPGAGESKALIPRIGRWALHRDPWHLLVGPAGHDWKEEPYALPPPIIGGIPGAAAGAAYGAMRPSLIRPSGGQALQNVLDNKDLVKQIQGGDAALPELRKLVDEQTAITGERGAVGKAFDALRGRASPAHEAVARQLQRGDTTSPAERAQYDKSLDQYLANRNQRTDATTAIKPLEEQVATMQAARENPIVKDVLRPGRASQIRAGGDAILSQISQAEQNAARIKHEIANLPNKAQLPIGDRPDLSPAETELARGMDSIGLKQQLPKVEKNIARLNNELNTATHAHDTHVAGRQQLTTAPTAQELEAARARLMQGRRAIPAEMPRPAKPQNKVSPGLGKSTLRAGRTRVPSWKGVGGWAGTGLAGGTLLADVLQQMLLHDQQAENNAVLEAVQRQHAANTAGQ